MSDGFLREAGQSVSTSAAFELDYGVTDRLSASVAIPYVFARYTGSQPPRSGLPVDACGCWHSSFQDFAVSVRYRLGEDPWAVTPVARYVRPSHDYPYQGEAVVGRNLEEFQVGFTAGAKLVGFLPKAAIQLGYTYSFVEEPIDISINRSNGFIDLGYALTPRLYVRAAGIWQYTHGGLRFGSVTGNPFFPPGELNTPERIVQGDRLLKTKYWQVAGGLAYSLGPVDIFGAYSKYIWGRDAHNGNVFSVGATWYFDLLE